MAEINLSVLTEEQKADLKRQLEEEQQQKKQKAEDDKKAYKDLVNETIDKMFGSLNFVSSQMKQTKRLVFDSFKSVIDMKKDLFKIESKQVTHTFTNEDSTKRITIGYRTNDNYDDTVEEGIEKVKKYLKSLAKDEKSGQLVDIVNSLLSKDQKGNLKASRVLTLYKYAVESGDKEFLDGVEIIQKAYKPKLTKTFISAARKDEQGSWISVPLSMTDN